MNDIFDRLQQADPVKRDHMSTGDLAALKARVMHSIDVHSVPYVSRRRTSATWLAGAAAAVVLAGASGVVGYSIAPDSTPLAIERGPVGPALGAADSKSMSSMIANYGLILEPAPSIPNAAGAARAYEFTADGVDAQAFVTALAKLVGASGLQRDEQSFSVGANDGKGPSAYLGRDSMLPFNALDPQKSPWFCEEGKACAEPSGQGPSEEQALALVRAAFSALGLPADVELVATRNGASTSVQALLEVEGKPIQATWSAEVSSEGIYALNGFAARIKPLPDYPIAGARDVALRTKDPRWAGLSPAPVSMRGQMVPFGEPVNMLGTATTTERDGRPVLSLQVNSVRVVKAESGLMQYVLPDRALLLPSWIYTTDDGQQIQMIAIDESYVDFR